MGDLWGCIKLSKLPDRFKSSMSHLVETLEDKLNQLNNEKVHIDTKINDLRETMKKLQSSNFFKFDSSIKKEQLYNPPRTSSTPNKFSTKKEEFIQKRKEKKNEKRKNIIPIIEKIKNLPSINLKELAVENIAFYILKDWTDESNLIAEEADPFCFYRAVSRKINGSPDKFKETKEKILEWLKKKKN